MFNRKKKTKSSLGVVRPGNRLLRLFRSNDVLQGSLSSSENTDREDAYSKDPRIIGNVMQEIEYQDAKALLAFQENRRFC